MNLYTTKQRLVMRLIKLVTGPWHMNTTREWHANGAVTTKWFMYHNGALVHTHEVSDQ